MKVLFERKTFTRPLPANTNSGDVSYFQSISNYDCPPLRVLQFESVNVLPDSTLFKFIFPLKDSFLFFKKRLKLHNKKGLISILLKWKKITLPVADQPYLIIHDPWTKNYYHWITQALPRLLLAQQLNEPFLLLLPEDHNSAFHIESLRLLNIHNWQTVECKRQYYKIRDLRYPSHDIQIGDYNDDLICLLRDKLARIKSSISKKRIFVHRVTRDHRRIVNEDAVLQVFVSYNFEIVEFERLSFLDQITLMSEVSLLAGVHGAGLTNMIFMPTLSKVFELTTTLNGENYYYYTLSNSLSHHYYYQLCAPDRLTTVQQANLIVDIDLLKKNISSLISDEND